jgi:hypothetical protein
MRKFTFFKGLSKPTLTASWTTEVSEDDLINYNTVNAEQELTRMLSAEIARTIDEDIIRRLTQEINGGLRA